MRRMGFKECLCLAVLLWSSAVWSQPDTSKVADSTVLLEGILDRAFEYHKGKKLDSALMVYNEVLNSNPNEHLDEEKLLELHNKLSAIYRAGGMHDKALKHSLKFLQLAEEMGDSTQIMNGMNKVAIIYAMTKQFKQALSIFKKVNNYAIRNNDGKLEMRTTTNIGGCLLDSGNLELGIAKTKLALSRASEIYKDDLGNNNYRRTVGGLCFNLSDIYKKQGDSLEALRYAKKGLFLRKTRKNPWEIAASYGQLFSWHLGAGNYSDARLYLDSFENMQAELLKGQTSILKYKMLYHKGVGDYKKAYAYARLLRKASDSLNKAESDKQLNLYKRDFVLSQTATQLRLLKKSAELSEQKLALQNEKLENRNIQRRILIIAVVLSLIVMVLIYKRLKAKSEFAVSLNHKNKEISLLLKELQHRVKNNMQTILGLYETTLSRVPKSFPKEELLNFKNALTSLLLIQKKLFISDNKTLIALDDFIESFTEEYAVVKAHDKDVAFDLQLAKAMVSSEFGSKLALMLNELISNSYEHAFQEVTDPKIIIKTTLNESTLLLKYADNGTAFNLDEGLKQSGKMGLKILESLVSEVRGTIEHSEENKEYQFSFEIQHDNYT